MSVQTGGGHTFSSENTVLVSTAFGQLPTQTGAVKGAGVWGGEDCAQVSYVLLPFLHQKAVHLSQFSQLLALRSPSVYILCI